MAEIIILVIFLLLLAFSTLLNRAQKDTAQISVLIAKNKSQIERIAKVVNQQEPDMAEELVRVVENLPPVIAKVTERQLKKGEEEKIEQVLARGIDKLVIEKNTETPGEEEAEEELSPEQQLEQEKEKTASLQEQVVSLKEALRKGVGPPPCWNTGNDKYTEYIYRAELTSKGIILRDIAQERWATDKAKLPLQSITLGKPLSIGTFVSQVQPLWSYSQKEDCRFLVQIADQTQPAEKEFYQGMIKAVSDHFQPDGYGRKGALRSTNSDQQSAPAKKGGGLFERLFKKQDKPKNSRNLYN
ncbi:MAG: hypothetical protein PW788_06070 [Micavibrio sp.]|nr:hypothetical protein [Micavibrio sp.]